MDDTLTPPVAALPWGTHDDGSFTRAGTWVAAVAGTFAVFLTFPLGVVGIVLSNMGLNRIRRQDASAGRYLLASWICFVPATVIGVPLTLYALALLVKSLFG